MRDGPLSCTGVRFLQRLKTSAETEAQWCQDIPAQNPNPLLGLGSGFYRMLTLVSRLRDECHR